MTAVDTERVLARNTAWNYAGFALNLATNLVMFPFVVHRLGDAATGVWLLLSSVTGYMGLLELGIVPSLTQTIAAAVGRGDRDGVDRAASTAQAVLAGLGIVSLGLWFAGPLLTQTLGIGPELRDQALIAFRISVVGFACRMPLATYQAILLGRQRQDRCSQLWIVLGVAKFAGAALVLTTGFGLVALVATEMALHLAAGVLQVIWVREELPSLRLSWRLVTRADASRLLSFGGAILAVSLCALLIEQSDRLVVAAFLPVAMVTYYAAAWKLYMLCYTLTTTMVQAMAPIAADLHGRDDRAGIRLLFMRNARYSSIVAWPLACSFALAGGVLLRFWMGDDFLQSLPVVQVLAAGFLVTAPNHAGYSALVGTRRVLPVLWQYFAPQAVLNVVLSIWLVRRVGIVGVALGTLLPALLLEYPFLTLVLTELQIEWRDFLRRVILPAAAAAIGGYLPLAIAYSLVAPDSPLLAIIAALCTLVYLALAWRTLDAPERRALVDFTYRALRLAPKRSSATSAVAAASRGDGI